MVLTENSEKINCLSDRWRMFIVHIIKIELSGNKLLLIWKASSRTRLSTFREMKWEVESFFRNRAQMSDDILTDQPTTLLAKHLFLILSILPPTSSIPLSQSKSWRRSRKWGILGGDREIGGAKGGYREGGGRREREREVIKGRRTA